MSLVCSTSYSSRSAPGLSCSVARRRPVRGAVRAADGVAMPVPRQPEAPAEVVDRTVLAALTRLYREGCGCRRQDGPHVSFARGLLRRTTPPIVAASFTRPPARHRPRLSQERTSAGLSSAVSSTNKNGLRRAQVKVGSRVSASPQSCTAHPLVLPTRGLSDVSPPPIVLLFRRTASFGVERPSG